MFEALRLHTQSSVLGSWRLDRLSWDLLNQPQALAELLLKLALPAILAVVLVHMAVRALRTFFPQSHPVRLLERWLSWGVWVVLVLWLSGFLPLLLDELEDIKWRLGGVTVTLRTLLEGAFSTLVVLALSLWLSSVIESRLLAGVGPGTDASQLSLRKMAANVTRAVLLTVGVLVAMSAVGIPLTTLGVFGGALGVGIGLGLQKLAANYVSGFVILAERSLRIGDTVRVDNFEGRITDIKTRYTVIRAISGREAIVPNELLLTQRIENATLADSRVLVSTTVQVDADTDIQALVEPLKGAVAAVPRVLADPGPGVQFSQFVADGFELQVLFWIGDPENGQGNVKSEVNHAILRVLREQGVQFPVSTRVIRRG